MGSDLIQSLAVAMIVIAAGLFLARRAWRTISASRRAGSEAACGADGTCGCHTTDGTVEPEALTKRG
jgi:hypothetical protein